MKKISFFVMALCTMALVSCGGGNSPSGTVKSYLDCLKSGKYEKAIGYFDLDKSDEAQLKMLVSKMEQSIKEQGGLTSYELVKGGETISEDGNSASVAIRMTMGDETEESTLKLKNIDGEWKIDLLSK